MSPIPSTTPDSFPYEILGDQPGESLHGGQDGTHPILAEVVQQKVATMDATISALQSRVSALEDGTGGVGWIPIGAGDTSGSSFSVDLTAGGRFPDPPLWTAIRVYARLDLDAVARVSLRINSDSSTIYRSGASMVDAAGNLESADGWYHDTADRWEIGHLSQAPQGSLELLILHAGGGLATFQCTTGRISGNDQAHRYTSAWGSLQGGSLTPSSLLFFVGTSATGGDEFAAAWWRAEGLRMEHPT